MSFSSSRSLKLIRLLLLMAIMLVATAFATNVLPVGPAPGETAAAAALTDDNGDDDDGGGGGIGPGTPRVRCTNACWSDVKPC